MTIPINRKRSTPLDIEVIENFTEPLWRLNNLYWCVTEKGKKVPFRLNSAQERLFREMWFWNIVLKSRQHGFTTFIDIMALDCCLFNDDFSAGINAHTREDVEKIFDKKVKFPYKCLPEGLKAKLPADTDTAKMLKFPNGSSLEVGTSLRSGTFQFLHISEFGKVCAKYPDKAKEIVTGTLETVHQGSFVFIESTAEGNEGYFHNYCKEAMRLKEKGLKLNKLQYKFHFFAWFEDPKNSLPHHNVLITKEHHKYFDELYEEHGIVLDNDQKAWYAEKERKLNIPSDSTEDGIIKNKEMRQEHPSYPDEAFQASIEGAYLKKQMAILRRKGMIGPVAHVPNIPVNTGWDLGKGDDNYIWFHQRVGLQERIINVIHNSGEDLAWYVQEMQKLGYVFGNHFVPHDAGHKRLGLQDGRSLDEQLYDLGLRNIYIIPQTPTKRSAIEESRAFLPTCWIDQENCNQGIKCLDNYKKEWNKQLACFRDKPLHNWASHGYDGYESLARGITMWGPGDMGEEKPRESRRPPRNWRVG